MKKSFLKAIGIACIIMLSVEGVMSQELFDKQICPIVSSSKANSRPEKSHKSIVEEALWNNMDIEANLIDNGFPSGIWPNIGIVLADDFEASSKCTITKVACKSFMLGWAVNDITLYYPVNLIINFYMDNNGKPGEELHSSTVPGGETVIGIPFTVTLPEPFKIKTPGRYWVSIHGIVEDFNYNSDIAYYLFIGDKEIGHPMHIILKGFDISDEWMVLGDYFTDSAECKSLAFILIGDDNVSIGNLEESITIYPNPTSNSVIINATEISRVEIFNLMGQLIEIKTGNVSSIDVSSYSNGVYLFKLYNADHAVTTKRVVVTK